MSKKEKISKKNRRIYQLIQKLNKEKESFNQKLKKYPKSERKKRIQQLRKDIQYLAPQKTKLRAGTGDDASSGSTCDSSSDNVVDHCEVPHGEDPCQQGWNDDPACKPAEHLNDDKELDKRRRKCGEKFNKIQCVGEGRRVSEGSPTWTGTGHNMDYECEWDDNRAKIIMDACDTDSGSFDAVNAALGRKRASGEDMLWIAGASALTGTVVAGLGLWGYSKYSKYKKRKEREEEESEESEESED